MELVLQGNYANILRYMQSLEKLDWRLLWDEIELETQEYPNIEIRLVISTISMREEWVGI